MRDIDEARDFYGIKMKLAEGRSAENWIDFNMFGHQFVTHLNPQIGKNGKITNISNPVDGHDVPDTPSCGISGNGQTKSAASSNTSAEVMAANTCNEFLNIWIRTELMVPEFYQLIVRCKAI